MHENLRSTYNIYNLIIVYKIMKYLKYNVNYNIQHARQVSQDLHPISIMFIKM